MAWCNNDERVCQIFKHVTPKEDCEKISHEKGLYKQKSSRRVGKHLKAYL
jgi:hypothetical protein